MEASSFLPISLQVLGSATIIVLSGAYFFKSLFSNFNRSTKSTQNNDVRRMSYTSALVAMGSLPETTKVCDPLIHLLISFDGTDCPSEDDLVPLVYELMKYERMAGI